VRDTEFTLVKDVAERQLHLHFLYLIRVWIHNKWKGKIRTLFDKVEIAVCYN